MEEVQKKNVLDEFETWLYAKHVSESTASKHRTAVRQYLDYHGDLLPTPAEQKGLDYKVYLKDEDYSNSHINNHTTAIEYYYRWRDETEEVELGYERREDDTPDALTQAEYSAILRTIQNKRDFAIFMFMTGSGIRAGECAELDIGDINWSENKTREIPIKGRGERKGDYRFIDDAREAVDDYLETRYNTKADDPLFTSLTNPDKRLERNGYNQLYERLGKRAGCDRKINPHLTRGYFITEGIRNGVDLKTLSNLVNHRSIEMTSKYVQLAEEDEKDEFDRAYNS